MDIRAIDDMRPKDEITKTVLVNMRYYMELTGQEDFSYLEDTGISQQTIRNLVTGKTSADNMSISKLMKIADALCIPFADLFITDEEKLVRIARIFEYALTTGDDGGSAYIKDLFKEDAETMEKAAVKYHKRLKQEEERLLSSILDEQVPNEKPRLQAVRQASRRRL